jgi:hypothetical protein
MKRVVGDLWTFHPTHWIVVPVNCGWNKRGQAIMGMGVALQAAKRFPHLREVWGVRCRQLHTPGNLGVLCDTESRCILFPTKPLDTVKPAFSWRLPASVDLIDRSTLALHHACKALAIRPAALPLIGCGAGGLQRHEVLPILERLDDNFTLVEMGSWKAEFWVGPVGGHGR